jgi:hypothetical protein
VASLSVIHCGLCFWQAHHSGLPHRRNRGILAMGPLHQCYAQSGGLLISKSAGGEKRPADVHPRCNSEQRGSPSSRSARAPVYRGMGRGEYSHVGLKSPSQWELSRHLKDWLAHGYLPQQGRAASLMSRSVHSGWQWKPVRSSRVMS